MFATAAYYNSLIEMYSPLGINIANVAVGQPIRASFEIGLLNQVVPALAANNAYAILPSKTQIQVGQPIRMLHYGPIVYNSAPAANNAVTPVTTMYSTPGSKTITVPASGVSQVQVNWIVGAGGGGGFGSQLQYGGGGGGGGAGGYAQNLIIDVNPNDQITLTIGAGGPGGTTGAGQAGGTTTIQLNGTTIYTATGGLGGTGGSSQQYAGANAPGGSGGAFNATPNGLTGQTGPGGSNDHASSYGGAGAPGPVSGAYGGAGGTTGGGSQTNGASAGVAGVGAGAGGGGAGAADRTAPYAWYGGAGANGFVELTVPASPGSGTPAANNSSYNVNALLATGAQGGGYSGGTGVVGSGFGGAGVRAAQE